MWSGRRRYASQKLFRANERTLSKAAELLQAYAGEQSLGMDDRMAVLARLWFDNELKKEMAQ